MKKLAVFALISILASASAQATPTPDTLADQVAAIVQPQLAKHSDLDLGVAVGIVQPASEGAILTHIFYYGKLVDRNGSPLTLDGATEFEIGSVSKTFTTTILASLVQNDPSILDLSTNSIFPHTPTFMGSQTTIRDLADYTSGLPDSNRDGGSSTCTFNGGQINDCYDISLMFDNLLDPALSALQFAPGTQYLYSDLAVALLAFAEPVLAGLVKNNPGQLRHGNRLLQDWESMLGFIALAPLGMNSTHPFSPVLDPPVLPRGYHSDRMGISVGLDHNESWPSFMGAGGIVSTPNDMMLYLEYNLGLLHNSLNSLLPALHSPATLVRTPAGEQLGLGWFIGKLKGADVSVISKNGGVPAFGTEIEFAPSTSTGVVVLGNASASKGGAKIVDEEMIAYQVLQIINGVSPTTPGPSFDEP